MASCAIALEIYGAASARLVPLMKARRFHRKIIVSSRPFFLVR
jgi:hypothetical protein